jgi:hypothetical protein
VPAGVASHLRFEFFTCSGYWQNPDTPVVGMKSSFYSVCVGFPAAPRSYLHMLASYYPIFSSSLLQIQTDSSSLSGLTNRSLCNIFVEGDYIIIWP